MYLVVLQVILFNFFELLSGQTVIHQVRCFLEKHQTANVTISTTFFSFFFNIHPPILLWICRKNVHTLVLHGLKGGINGCLIAT